MSFQIKVVLVCFLTLLLAACSDSGGSAQGDSGTDSENSTIGFDNPIEATEPVGGADPTATPDPALVAETGGEDSVAQPDTPLTSTAAPNFLFIISDDQGLDASAQYSLSQDLPNTPVVNGLAERGLVFDNAWATPSCTTTRGSIISGQHGINSGVITTPSLLDVNSLTLQRHLGNAIGTAGSSGYATAVVGKWHLAGGNTQGQLTHPNDVGVDYYAGNITGTVDSYFDWPLNINGTQTTSNTYHTTKVTDLAIDWIQSQEDPWFMWLAYVAPHSPFHLPPEDLHTQELSGDASDIRSNPRDYYLAAIEAMDTEIGRLLQTMPADTLDNTMIVFLGDNGTPRSVIDTAAFERTHGKGSLYEGGMRVPMIVAGSGVNRFNEREDALINSTDLFATVSQAAGLPIPAEVDGQSFLGLLSDASEPSRTFNYSEFVDNDTSGWATRNQDFKLIVNADGTRELYDLVNDPRELSNLIAQTDLYSEQIAALQTFGESVRSEEATQIPSEVDLTGATLVSKSASCRDYVNTYTSNAVDVFNNINFNGDLTVSIDGNQCVFTTNAIPNHDFNDGSRGFPNTVSEQVVQYRVPQSPQLAPSVTPLSLDVDNAIMLNGVKVDILAAGCFGVGDGRTGCNDANQPWRFDPLNPATGFLVDSHNAHTQPDGTYHYHGEPNALFSSTEAVVSPVVGFAADGFPIYGSYILDEGEVRKVQSSYRLRTGPRPTGEDQPGGVFDGLFRDDYEYVPGLGDLDECNGLSIDGSYRYYITDDYPYVLGCFSGIPDDSFIKN